MLVAAVGNSAIDASQILPAGIQRVLSVGASRFDGQRASYSNFGPVLDVLAPGGQIGLDQNNDGIDDLILSTLGVDLALEQGTSMAAPHVAGLAALIVSQKPELTHDQVHNLIRDTANIAFQCNEGCGRGIVDAAAALLAANVQVVPEPRLSLSAQTVAFNGGINQGTIRVQNLGALPAPFTVTIERGQASLFSVTPTSGTVAAAGGSITLNLTLNRGSATVGSTTLVVRGTGAADGQQLTAELNFNDSPSRGVRSLDAVEVGAYQRTDDGNLVRRGEAIALRANNFAYEIKGLTPGDYELFAVGDDNFDGTFDSQRESIGAFPITTEPQAVTIENVGDTVPDINFGVALRAVNRDKDVGSPCTEANKQQTCSRILDTAPDVGCIEGFPGGYCSRFCDDNICGPNGRCDELECAGAPCKVCLQRCVSDSQCRDGYICVLDTCVPPGFDDGF